MSVHNGAPWVSEAIGSLVRQTMPDFELIVIDDGSTDTTPGLLGAVSDPRVRVERQEWRGLTPSLNRALGLSRAPLLARMDADDVAVPERFAKQMAFLDAHPEVGLLGTGCQEIAPSGEILGTVRPPVDDGAIRRALIRRNPFVHSSVMLRRAVLEQVGGYDEQLDVAQDYDLWLRIGRVTRLANLPDPLVLRRLAPGRVSSVRDSARLRAEVRIKLRALRSGAYPAWCVVFLAKPLLALTLPGVARRFLRRAMSREASRGVS